MLNFCTLFDSNYLTRGLAMYRSLEKTCPSFHLYVFAFDDATCSFLRNNPSFFPRLTVIALNEFEDEQLLKIKPYRTTAEYCWTATPSTILYCINKFQLTHCTYIDADLYFYSNPQVLIDEMGNKSVLISEHRYTRAYDQSAYSGVYCVQFMCFKNTAEGLQVLTWWRDRCIEWCYARLEDGKFGDQKYLDDWTARFSAVHVLQHLGGGVAPWNVQQYYFTNDAKLTEKKTGRSYPLVFYHFHGLKFYTDDRVSLCGSLYELGNEARQLLYYPYIRELLETERELREKGVTGNVTGASSQSPSKVKWVIQFLRETAIQIKNGKLSPFNLKYFNFNRHYHIHSIKYGVPDRSENIY